MKNDIFLDVHSNDPRWGHAFAPGTDGVRLHYVQQGRGPAVVLLRGWPGFWYDWRRIIPRLAQEANVIAPDFRGFGDSDKPDRPPAEAYTSQVFANDIIALLDHLGLDEVVVAAHDIGATVAQVLARTVPERIRILTLFNPPYHITYESEKVGCVISLIPFQKPLKIILSPIGELELYGFAPKEIEKGEKSEEGEEIKNGR